MYSCSFLLFLFFFFKQKTAYEMRISDWSSDVCSSDLVRFLDGNEDQARRKEGGDDGDPEHRPEVIGRQPHQPDRQTRPEESADRVERLADRKSVVSGKSVSVSVDLGGRRILKKQNRRQYTYRPDKR